MCPASSDENKFVKWVTKHWFPVGLVFFITIAGPICNLLPSKQTESEREPVPPIDTPDTPPVEPETIDTGLNNAVKRIDSNTTNIMYALNILFQDEMNTVNRNSSEVESEIISNENTSDDFLNNRKGGITAQVSEPKPRKGYGKFALRSFCNYCNELSIKIAPDSGKGGTTWGTGKPLYDPLNKTESTFIFELEPGMYTIELNYGERMGIGKFRAKIVEGKISLYNFKKTNPFGKKLGCVVVYSEYPSDWKLKIDSMDFGVVYLSNRKGDYYKLPAGRHSYRLEKVKRTTMDKDSIVGEFILNEGEMIPITGQ